MSLYQKCIARVEKAGIPEKNKKKILEIMGDAVSNGVQEKRIGKYVACLKNISKLLEARILND